MFAALLFIPPAHQLNKREINGSRPRQLLELSRSGRGEWLLNYHRCRVHWEPNWSWGIVDALELWAHPEKRPPQDLLKAAQTRASIPGPSLP